MNSPRWPSWSGPEAETPPSAGRAATREQEGSPPVFHRRALERWDRVLGVRESLRLVAAACRKAGSRPPARILELGCRTGLATRLWLRLWPAHVTAVDVSEERLALASARTTGPLWLRRDPRYLTAPLPGAPFDAILVHPWVSGGVRPERLAGWLQDLAGLLTGDAAPAGPSHRTRGSTDGRLFLTLYRPGQLAQRWGHGTGGQDTGQWAWAWEGSYLAAERKQELHLIAFVPSGAPGLFDRMDEFLALHVHTEEALRRAAQQAGLSGAGRPAARSGSQLLYELRPQG